MRWVVRVLALLGVSLIARLLGLEFDVFLDSVDLGEG
jgi:hypothetical protein